MHIKVNYFRRSSSYLSEKVKNPAENSCGSVGTKKFFFLLNIVVIVRCKGENLKYPNPGKQRM